MTETRKPLQLAHVLESGTPTAETLREAAAELRRLQARAERLGHEVDFLKSRQANLMRECNRNLHKLYAVRKRADDEFAPRYYESGGCI